VDLLTRLRSGLESADVEDLPAWPSLATGVDAAPAGEAWAAIGAAMLGLGRGEAAPLNLVPADWAETERLQKRLLGVVASVGLAILVSVGITSGIRMLVGNTAKQAEAASAEVAVNTEAVKTVGALRRQAAEAAAQVKLWQQVRGQVRPYDWAAGLDAIISQIPEGVRVQQVGFKGGLIRLAGEAQSTDLLHQLVQRLSRLACLEEANLERLIRTPAGGPSPAEGPRPAGGNRLAVYTITCRFREPAAPKPQEPKP
jgi:Tfp pilus assembly protein PilN